MNYLQGLDISSWQDDPTTSKNVDFVKMKDAGAKFCFFRAFFGLGKDRDFDYYWKTSKEVGLPRGAYMFPITTISIVDQTNAFINLLRPDKGEIYPVIDIENYKGTVPRATDIRRMIGMIETGLGVSPMIYTGYYVWREIIGTNDHFFSNYALWIATYGSKPMVPPPWTDWLFWQATDNGDGIKYGVESKNIDVDYFNGDAEKFNSLFMTDVEPPIPPDPIIPSDSLTYQVISQMNVRTGAGTNYPVSSVVPAGTIIKAKDVGGNDAWVKFEDGWICKSLNGKNYLDLIE